MSTIGLKIGKLGLNEQWEKEMRRVDQKQGALNQPGDFMQESDIDRQRRERFQALLQENRLPLSSLLTAPPPGVRRPER